MNNFSIYLSLLVCLVGLVVWWVFSNPKPINETGRICFMVGLLVFLATFANKILHS